MVGWMTGMPGLTPGTGSGGQPARPGKASRHDKRPRRTDPVTTATVPEPLRVVHIEEDLRPWRLGRVTLDAISVLEVPARTVWASGTDIGDQLEIAQSAGVAA